LKNFQTVYKCILYEQSLALCKTLNKTTYFKSKTLTSVFYVNGGVFSTQWEPAYYHLTVGVQGQAKWAKVAKKSSTYDVTQKKNVPPKQKNFFQVQSTRLADPFEPLNSSPAQWAEELGHW